ncbi:MAG: dipicolinate synthase subunit DpsA [Clostridia bacterium]
MDRLAIIGGDLRQIVVARLLSENYEIATYGFDNYDSDFGNATKCGSAFDAINKSAAIILPLPYTRDKINVFMPLSKSELLVEDVISMIKPECALIGGMLDSNIKMRHYMSFDYYEREELQILNAIPTAEGAIGIAMEETPITLFSSKCVVIGFGRVSKILASRLKGLGAKVTICARKQEDLAYAEAFGYKGMTIETMKEAFCDADVIFNTVPSIIITEDMFESINRQTPIIDLASRPGGIDFEKAKRYGLKVIWALSLPGKVAPVTAGKIIKTSITNILNSI